MALAADARPPPAPAAGACCHGHGPATAASRTGSPHCGGISRRAPTPPPAADALRLPPAAALCVAPAALASPPPLFKPAPGGPAAASGDAPAPAAPAAASPRRTPERGSHDGSHATAFSAGAAAADASACDAAGPAGDADGRGWQYALVTCPWLFKPCPTCCPAHSGRDSLMTLFDPAAPSAPRGLCGFCPGRAAAARGGGGGGGGAGGAGPSGLLQIRRSTYHEVVKAADLARRADVAGVQHYVINGAKVLFLRPRPQPRPPKGVAAPARCVVDGRQLMDGAARYCSLQCKLEAEDPHYAARHALAAARAAVAAEGLAVAPAAAGPAADGAPAAGAKRPAGLARFDAEEEDERGDGGSDGGAGGAFSWATPPPRAKRPRGVPVFVPRGAAAPPPSRGRTPEPAAAARRSSPPPPRAPRSAASPATSQDSGRSSQCLWHAARRRKGEPARAPLQ
ncbi:hypothetical protein Rsub_01545 [Raphidocelis subcapitata]|uniref:Uncharacterized protein n=1 Tax=Raphidocelis subcapitata TaxID=307507 RepID=A0A2V0NMD2_9CHLO|nr:hypothetical protein Rsub_01545 [Raphidocelis subcapitata]|eukprot:GBF88646.1 hypothetical protein Rsub_01545 [Raphidocelis subcapitata]